jgi:hypothetical protein
MTTSRRLAAHRDHAPVAQANPLPVLDAEDDETDDDSNPEKDQDMTEEEMQAAIAAARKEGFDAANARFTTVTASEHYAGREQLASNLLGTDLTAEQIIAALGASAPPLVAIAPATLSTTASDDAAREEMRAAIQQNTNAAVETGAVAAPTGADAPDQKAVADGFAKGAAFANQMNGF